MEQINLGTEKIGKLLRKFAIPCITFLIFVYHYISPYFVPGQGFEIMRKDFYLSNLYEIELTRSLELNETIKVIF